MYAVVAIGSRMRRSACGMNFRTFCCAVAAHGTKAAAHSSAVAMRLIEPVDRKKRLIIGTLIYWNKNGRLMHGAVLASTQRSTSPGYCSTGGDRYLATGRGDCSAWASRAALVSTMRMALTKVHGSMIMRIANPRFRCHAATDGPPNAQ